VADSPAEDVHEPVEAEQHEWMVRSCSLSLFFVIFSLWAPALAHTPLPPAVSYPLPFF
jgi:hypothetical protein